MPQTSDTAPILSFISVITKKFDNTKSYSDVLMCALFRVLATYKSDLTDDLIVDFMSFIEADPAFIMNGVTQTYEINTSHQNLDLYCMRFFEQQLLIFLEKRSVTVTTEPMQDSSEVV